VRREDEDERVILGIFGFMNVENIDENLNVRYLEDEDSSREEDEEIKKKNKLVMVRS
jgi:hypothetical protein